MSDQIPGNVNERDPSMEDILASIRRVIAEDTPVQASADTQSLEIGSDDLDASPDLYDLGFEQDQILDRVETPQTPQPDIMADLGGADIDDRSTEELLSSIDFDLSDDLAELHYQSAMVSNADFEEILDLTEAIGGSPVSAQQAAGSESAEHIPMSVNSDENFDEDMDLAKMFGDVDLGAPEAASLSVQETSVKEDALSAIFDNIDEIADSSPLSDDADSTLGTVVDFEADSDFDADIDFDAIFADEADADVKLAVQEPAQPESAETLSAGEAAINEKLAVIGGSLGLAGVVAASGLAADESSVDTNPLEPISEDLNALDVSQFDALELDSADLADLELDSVLENAVSAELNSSLESALEDLLPASEQSPQAEQVIDPAADLVKADFEAPLSLDVNAKTLSAGQDEDIDLVKSLMAELTDDSFDDSALSLDLPVGDEELDSFFDMSENELKTDEESMDSLTAIIAEANAEAKAAGNAALEAGQDNGLEALSVDDSALEGLAADMAEIDAGDSSDVLSLEGADLSLALDEELPDLNALLLGEETLALEADEIEEDSDVSALAGLAGLLAGSGAAVGAAVLKSNEKAEQEPIIAQNTLDQKAETDLNVNVEAASLSDELDAGQNTEKLEDKPMPHIVKSEAVASDDTIEAASGAFASLNKVVEEKAVYNESGPRIGDLVQQALRPMLQEWLDANLKGIVDRAVSKEIKRISSGK